MNNGRESKLQTMLRWILGGLLVWAALSKIANLQDFYIDLSAYKLPFPDAALRLTAVILPWLELLCGLLLIGKVWPRAALTWAIILFGVFVISTGQAWARGLNISCGCFNLRAFGLDAATGKSFIKFVESVGFAFGRAVFLFLGAVYLFRFTGREQTGEPN
jgi:putative oxidoreductase